MNCPDDNTLAAFLQGKIAAETVSELEDHIDICDLCTHVVSMLTDQSVDIAIHNSPDNDSLQEASGRLSSESPRPPLQPGAKVDRYLVVRAIGNGAMGIVYLAYDPDLNRRVALKLLHPKLVATHNEPRLQQEAQTLARLKHPNIVSIYDIGQANGHPYIAMEYVDGINARDWKRQAEPSQEEIIEVYIHAAEGLAAAHNAGTVHRDFKPDNLLVEAGGRAVVSDFGLARVATQAPTIDAAMHETQIGALVGTPAYMAPEQLGGDSAIAASDQFAFCVSLYESLTGQRPFVGKSPPELLATINKGRNDIDRLPIPRRIRRVLTTGLASDPDKRFPSMDAMLDAMRPTTKSSRIGLLLTPALAALTAASIVFFVGATDDETCAGSDRHLQSIWNPTEQAKARMQFLKASKSGRESNWDTSVAALQEYRDDWSETHKEVCLANNVYKDQTVPVSEAQMLCLARQKYIFSALVEGFTSGSQPFLRNAPNLVGSLPAPQQCRNVDAISGLAPPPTNDRPAIESAEKRLAKINWLLSAGDLRGAKKLLPQVGKDLESVDYPLTQLHFQLMSARYASESRQESGLDDLSAVMTGAESRGFNRMRARATLLLANHLARQTTRFEEAARWARSAEALTRRIDEYSLETDAIYLQGAIALHQGRYAKAEEFTRRALQRAKASDDDDIMIRVSLAETLEQLGNPTEAIDILLAAEKAALKRYGSAHKKTWNTRTLLARMYVSAGNPEQAIAPLEAVLADRQTTPASPPVLASTMLPLAAAYQDTGQFSRAEPLLLKAHKLVTTHQKPDPALVAESLGYLSNFYMAQENYSKALPLQRQQLALAKRFLKTERHPAIAIAYTNLATSLLGLKNYTESLRLLQHSMAIQKQTVGAEHVDVAWNYLRLGEAYFATKKHAKAIDYLERTIRRWSKNNLHPNDVIRAKYFLVRCLAALGRKARARTTAKAILADLKGKTLLDEQKPWQAWLQNYIGGS